MRRGFVCFPLQAHIGAGVVDKQKAVRRWNEALVCVLASSVGLLLRPEFLSTSATKAVQMCSLITYRCGRIGEGL